MLETSSSPAAEAMTPFASPMLASIERLVSRLARRIAGPQSQFTGRSLQFADRIFSRRLDTLGMGAAAAPETLFAERSMEPQSWLLPKTWVPSAAALRAGPMSVLPPVAESPASKRVAANTPLVAPAAVKQPDGAVKPPVVTPTAVVAPVVPGRSGFEQPMPQVSPAWSAEQPVPTVEAAKSAASAGTSGVTAAPETPAPKTAERLVGEVAASGPAVPLPAAEAAARPASAEAIVGASPQAAPAPELAESSASAAVASLTPTSAVNTVAASTIAAESRPVAAEPVATSSPGAAPVPQLTEAGSVAGSPSVTANAGSRPASAVAPSAAAVAVAVAQARAEQIVADERPRPASDTEPGLPAPTLVESAGRPLLSRAAPSAGIPIGAPSGSSGSPLETRVRDLLPPMLQRAAAASAPALGPLSAFSRSLGHLGWSDDRLGRTTSAERGKLPSLNFDGLAEPGSSSRAAAAPVLPMVQAADLTPRSATRPIGQLGQPVVAAPSAPSRAVAPLRQPGAAVPQPMVVLSQSDEQPSTLPRQAAISAAAPSAALGATAVAAPISAPISAPTSAESAVFGSASAAANSPAPMATTPAAAAISGASAETASALPGTESSAALPSAERTLARSVAQPARAPAQIGLSAPAGLSVGTRSLSPSLLASPALTAHGPASLVELFLSGQSARAGMSALGTLPALATTQPFRTPGALASHTERMATAIGTHVTAGSAGVGNPFGGGQRWSVAPGLTRMVSRALGRAESVAPGLWTKLSSELPYLEEPGNGPRAAQSAATATTPAAQPGAGIARLSPLLTMAAPGLAVSPMDATVAPMAHVRRPEFVPEALIGPPAAGPMSELRASGGVLGSATSTPSAPSAARPWQLAGGMATLAELFAAGVGMGTGAAGDIARQAGVAPAVGLMPPWLTKAAARSTFGLAASELASERSGRSLGSALEFVSDDGETPAVKSADPMARALSRSAALPPVSAPGQLAASAPQLVAAQSNSTAQSSPAATAAEAQSGAASRMPFWQHAGGLAATAEAFAGGHGIGRVAQQASGAPASAGHWVPVTGGMVFVSDEPQRAASPAAAAVAQPRPMLPSLALAAPAAGQTAAATPEAAASRAALPLAALPQVRPAAAESEVTAATPGPLALGRGVDWGRAGGLGLRTELFAAGLGSASMGAQPLSMARDLASWSTAPGVATPLAQALRQSEPTAPARWTFGDSGLLFVSEPGPADSAVATAGSAARRPASAGAQPGRPVSPLAASGGQPFVPAALTQVLAAGTTATAAGERLATPGAPATLGAPAPTARPWQQAGGTAILAELFSAGVGLGAGAASDLAQQAGVSSGRGPLPSWLSRLMASGATVPSSLAERLAGAGAALPFVPREERQPGATRLQGGQSTLARQQRLALPVATAALGASGQDLRTSAATAATDRRPLPVTATATAAPALWQRAGGLAASAEAFARGRGMESTAEESTVADDRAGDAAGRWLPVSGGMVFVPRERPTAETGKRAAAVRPGAPRLTAPPVERAVPAARTPDFQRAGGLGLRSELFAAGLGQSAAAAAGGDPLGGWASAHRMLASFPQQSSSEESPGSRFAWNGPGGLLYLAGASPAQRSQRRATPSAARRTDAVAPAAATSSTPTTTPALGSFATRAERFSSEFGEDAAGRSSERAVSANALPLASLFGGRDGERPAIGSAGSSASGAGLPASLASAMLTSFPRSVAGSAQSATALWPRTAMQSADRLTQLLAQLPAQWTPSAALAATMQASEAADSPLWQRLPASLLKLAGAALRGDQASPGEDGNESAVSERQPSLTLVKSAPSAAAQKAQRSAEPAWKQQTPHGMVSAALQKVAGSGTPMAAAAKMLESIRGSASGQSARSDDRISLGDMTLIALSMGENKMAAATQGHSPSTIPHVESAMRQGEVPSEPENEHTLSKKVDHLAKMVLKYIDKNEKAQKERGDFDA